VNLAEMSRSPRKDTGTTRTRQTLAPPAARASIKPGQTTSVPNDTTMAPRVRPSGTTTTPLEGLVTAPLPVAPDSASLPSTTTLSSRTDFYQIGR